MSGTRKSQSTNRADTKGRRTDRVDTSSSARAEYPTGRFYDSDRSLARIVAEFLDDGFKGGSPGIVVATANQRAEIIRELADRSFDVIGLQRSHDLVLLDAEETLSRFMMDGKPDGRKFRDQMYQVIERVSRGRTDCTVRIFGQMVDVLWQKGERDAAVRLELVWNQLAQTEASSLLCRYAIGNFVKDASFEDICRQHSDSVSADDNANRIASTACDRNRRRLERRGRR
jgi:hypothetical protein